MEILFAAVCIIWIHPLLGLFNLTLTGLSTAREDSQTPMMTNLLGLVGNMILDPLLILGFGSFPRLEVVGAAVTTVTSQILVLIVIVVRILRSGLEENILQDIHVLSRFPSRYYIHIFKNRFSYNRSE